MVAQRSVPVRNRRDPDTTRRELIDAAFEEIYRNGFRSSGIDSILASTGVTRGSLYHHFSSKNELGYAVVEERVLPLVRERYIQPFKDAADPIRGLHQMGVRMEEELLKIGILLMGCPVNNLVQEMSGVDEGFRLRLAGILKEWKDTIANGLRRGQADGTVGSNIDPAAVATFIVATYQGACGFAKNARDIRPFEDCRQSLDLYLETLRPFNKPQ